MALPPACAKRATRLQNLCSQPARSKLPCNGALFLDPGNGGLVRDEKGQDPTDLDAARQW
jgi:hypothetical protein